MNVRPVAVYGRLLVIAALVAAVFALTMPAQAQSATGRVRIMHASPDAPAVDVYVDGTKAVAGLAYPHNTGYLTVPAGTRQVKVLASPSTEVPSPGWCVCSTPTPTAIGPGVGYGPPFLTGARTPVLQATLTVTAGKDFTVLAVGQVADGSFALLPLEDNNALPAAGKAHVRFIHASRGTGPVDAGLVTPISSLPSGSPVMSICWTGPFQQVDAQTPGAAEEIPAIERPPSLVLENIAFKGASEYGVATAGYHHLMVQAAGTGTLLFHDGNAWLDSQRVYTVVLVGHASSGTLQTIMLLDAPTAPAPPKTGSGIEAGSNGTSLGLAGGLAAVVLSLGLGGAVAVRSRR